ncbi:NYN domain-containing protein [Candidatus Woesearchaeota archaeon]|nr:NYN domain-containing protein [Candidatus Woesearchaeota archaeon]
MKTNITQSVAILCDGNNIERSIQAQTQSNSMLNFDVIIPRLLNGRGLNRLIYFREGRQISSKLADRLHENFFGSVVPCHKSADIPLSIKATQLASKVDTIIILSGDSDYIDLVRHLKSEGVRVEISAVKDNTARILLEEVDFFHPITKEDWFEYNKPVRQQNLSYRNQKTSYQNYKPQNYSNLNSNKPIAQTTEASQRFDNIETIKQKLEANMQTPESKKIMILEQPPEPKQIKQAQDTSQNNVEKDIQNTKNSPKEESKTVKKTKSKKKITKKKTVKKSEKDVKS